jgi:radial spoke head protein 9
MESDYYIAVGTNFHGNKGFPSRRFFWCTNQSYTFSELPQPRTAARPIFDQLQILFQGVHTNVVVSADGHCDCLRLAPNTMHATEGQPITELDRLSFTVQQIDSNCSVVPKGSHKKTPLGEIHRNEAWEGCPMGDVAELSSYMYYRPVQSHEKQSMCDRKRDIFVADFLDCATLCEPRGSWTVTRDSSARVGILRNRVWPGFFAYCQGNSQVYGTFYFGNGVKNNDLPFMI